MELKVTCYCGQKYQFDVEPVNGRMPFAVNCPVCNADGTALADRLIDEQSSAIAPVPVIAVSPPAAESIVSPAAASLRMAPPAAITPPVAAVSAPPPLPASRPKPVVRPLVAAPPPEATYHLGLGILGAFLGAAAGGGLMYGFYLWTGFRFPLTGCGIGVLSGYAGRALARGGDTTMGIIAATFSACSVVGVFYLMYHGYFGFGIFSIVACTAMAYKVASY